MSGLSKHQLAVLIVAIWVLLSSLPTKSQTNFRIMFYNVENMYDVKDNPRTNDDDFTPDGQLHWTRFRYWNKLNNISKVISSVGGEYPPALVGLCEVENDSVLYDLTRRASLRKDKYEYIITKSKDARGSNVALLYQRDQMKIVSKKEYMPILEKDDSKTTRNILHITGRIVNRDTLDIFVCHFPSRREGIKKTRPYRITSAQLLKQKTDSIFRIRRKANIVIMGDFNDYPNDFSLYNTLEAKSVDSIPISGSLYNMFYNSLQEKNKGTYKYRGKWNFLDQFIVSGNLLNNSYKTSIKEQKVSIYSSDFLFEEDVKYSGQKPFRTYLGFKYLGGFSDHLPIYFDLIIK